MNFIALFQANRVPVLLKTEDEDRLANPQDRLRVLALTVRADIGGGPEHLYQLVQGFGGGVDTIIACPDEPPYRQRFAALPALPGIADIPHRAFRPGALFALARLARRAEVSIIHSHGKGAGLYGRLLAVLVRRPCVHTFHGLHTGEYPPLKKALYLALERVLGRFTSAAICVSRGEREEIRTTRILPSRKLRLVENGVALPDRPADRRRRAKLRIVAVSRYDHQKNPDLLIAVARSLKEMTQAPFRITVLGDGDRLEEMRQQVRAEGLEDVLDLSGPSESPRDIFRVSDIFLSTSRWEGMPLAVLEAMSEGLPVVATDVVGNRDVVEDGKTGRLYPDGNATAAAEAILLLTRDEGAAMGQAGRAAVAQNHSVQRMVGQTLAIYRQCLAGPERGKR